MDGKSLQGCRQGEKNLVPTLYQNCEIKIEVN